MDLTPQHQMIPRSGAQKLFAEAKAFSNRGDYQQAIQILQRANALEPGRDKILIELGSIYAMAYDFPSAERFFEEAIRVSSAKTDATAAVAQHWMDIRQFGASKNYFERALRENNVPPVVFIRLAEIYLRLRHPEDAAEIMERALRENGRHEGILLTRAKVFRQMRQLDDAEKMLRAAVSRSDAGAEARAAAFYELGTVLDQQKRYDEAMSAFLEAKSLMRLAVSGAVLAMLRTKQARFKEMREKTTEKSLQSWHKFGETQLQPARKLALLCGHPRSGTTLLEYVLDSHPQIVSADETGVFQSKAYPVMSRELSPGASYLAAIDSISPRNLRQIRREYIRGIETVLGQSIGDRLLIDKNPALTFDIPAMARIFPESKFLVALRDPRDVCLSCFMQASPVLPDSVPWLTWEGTVDYYASIMGLWLALKPLMGEAAIEVRYEDMVDNLEKSARRALDFLGCDWDERVLHFNEHVSGKTVGSPTYVEVAQPIYKSAVGRWRNYEKYISPHLEKLNPFLHAFGCA